MRLSILAVAILFLLIPYTGAWAGTTGKIAGTIKDQETGEPLVGANVVIEGTTRGAVSDVDGSYVILNVPPGEYVLSASLLGYVKETVKEVRVSVDLTTTIDFKLGSTVLEVGKEVVIVAERPVIKRDLTSSEVHVDASQIHSLPVHEVSEVLQLQSGITVDPGGGIHLRGGRTSEVAYWVDGVSLSDAYDGNLAVHVENNSIQELQVISGTFNAEYGQAMSGIVNIVTKDGEQKYHGNLSFYTGQYVTSNGGLNNGRQFVMDGTSAPDFLPNSIYYNMDKFRPFDNRNVEGSLSGPVPNLPLTFYVSGRYNKNSGWLYGNRVFSPTVSAGSSLYQGFTFVPSGTLDTNVVKIRRNAKGGYDTLVIGDNPVSMNDQERYSGQAKLTYQFTPQMKLNLSGLYSNFDYRNYNETYRLNPDGDVRDYDRGYNVSALFTHTINPTSFYTINASYLLKDFKEHLYESPFDPQYDLNPNAFATISNIDEYYSQGTNWHQFKRTTETRDLKIDYTNQLTRLHQFKMGIDARLHRLYLEDYSVTPEQSGNSYIATIPDYNGPLYQEYTQTPVEFSAYAQDKLEYDRMIVNIGMRFDYFNSNGQVLNDSHPDPNDPLHYMNTVNDPNVYLPQQLDHQGGLDTSLAYRLSYWYKKASAKSSFSPRFGISYPITDRGILHFSYGHFLQIPSFQYLYQSPGYKVTTASTVQGVYGNADLNPQKTVMYEFGLQQQLSEVLGFDVTGFYRDIRDWVSTSAEIPVRDPTTATTWYTMFINRDYANARGVTVSLTKRQSDMYSLNLTYTFQVAEGNNSDPSEEQATLASRPGLGATTPIEKIVAPLDWDQTHTLNLTVGVGKEDWGVFVLGRYGSGLPYTPVINQGTTMGYNIYQPTNYRRRPEEYNVDLRIFKNLKLMDVDFSVFLKVYNLFDTRNATGVYGQTGTAEATPLQMGLAGVTGPDRVNTVAQYLVNPANYSPPREVQVGVEMNF